MKAIFAALAAGLMIGAFAASYAALPKPPAKSDAEKAKDAAELGKAQDKAVANYKKNKGASTDAKKQ
jgi:hypothetical protein